MDLIESLACNDVDDIGLAIITIPVHVYLTFKHVQLSDVDHLLNSFLDFSRKLRHGERHNVRSTHSSEWVSGSSGGSVALAALATTTDLVGTGRQCTTSASISRCGGFISKTAGRVELKSTAQGGLVPPHVGVVVASEVDLPDLPTDAVADPQGGKVAYPQQAG